MGAGRESESIVIKNVQIHGPHANPIEVPSLMTDEGAHMQGVARDLIRITDVSFPDLTTSKYLFWYGRRLILTHAVLCVRLFRIA